MFVSGGEPDTHNGGYLLDFGWAAAISLDSFTAEIEGMGDVGYFAVLEKLNENFCKNKGIFGGFEVEKVSG
jgi:hypothetical protein